MTDPAYRGNERPPEPDRPDSARVDTDDAHSSARHGDPSISRPPTPAAPPDTHVEWVRPTDMAARAGARVMGKTADANQDVHELVRQASRDGAVRIRRALSHREMDLTPDVSTSSAAPSRGRQGVSR